MTRALAMTTEVRLPETGTIVARWIPEHGDEMIAAAVVFPVPVWEKLTCQPITFRGAERPPVPLEERIVEFVDLAAQEWEWRCRPERSISGYLDDDVPF